SGIISSVITFSQFKNFVNNPGNYASLSGAVVSTFTGGCFFGCAAAGWANDRFGRKRTIQIGAVFALWGCAMQSGANNFACLLVGRIVAGFAIGILSMTVPLYNTEIAPPKIRGFIVGLTQQMIGIGFIVANWVGYGCQFMNTDTQWRLPLGLQLIPAFLLLIGIQFLPYSPRWLLEQGRDDEACAVVHKLHDTGGAESAEAAENEFREMQATIRAEMSVRTRSLSDLWATRGMLKRTLVAVGVQVFGQFSGINVINYFGPSMYQALGLTSGQSLLVQGIYGAVGPITNFFFITLMVDTVGRKKPLMFGAASFVVTYSVLSAILALFPPSESHNFAAQRAGIAMIFITSICFSLSFGPVSWVLASEVFPTKTRSVGTSVATCANWAFNVLFSQVSNLAIANISWRYYLVFICLNAIDFVLIALFFPETKGKSLEQMAEVFGDEIDTREVALEEKLERDDKPVIVHA
ncbi:general substrate transporter, partial [Obba rivulosa]